MTVFFVHGKDSMSKFLNSIALPLIVALFCVWMITGCSSDENPVSSGEISGNLFPLATGRIWVSSAYELDTLGNKIELSTHREALYAHSSLTFQGRNAFLMIDSVYSTLGSLNFTDTTYMSTDGENFYLYLGQWVPVFKKDEGLNKEYVAGTFTAELFGVNVDVTVRCKILPKELVSVPKGTMEAYKLEIKTVVSLVIFSFEETLNVWFADGIGPVKFQTPPPIDPFTGQKTNGVESVLVSTNF